MTLGGKGLKKFRFIYVRNLLKTKINSKINPKRNTTIYSKLNGIKQSKYLKPLTILIRDCVSIKVEGSNT